jgi:hypothetical protein
VVASWSDYFTMTFLAFGTFIGTGFLAGVSSGKVPPLAALPVIAYSTVLAYQVQ